MQLSHHEVECSFWEPEPLPSIPERSKLCSLPPIGLGTTQVECLTSYMSRLADAHNLSVGSMFNWDLMSTAAAQFPQRLVLYSGGVRKNYGISDGSYDLNGLASRTEEWVKVLEQLTAIQSLHELTMSPFRHLLGDLRLLRRRRAWCSQCYESDRKTGTLYDRLIWCLQIVSRCPIHDTPLEEECPSCGKLMSHLAAEVLPGYSACCGAWLGSLEKLRDRHRDGGEFEAYVAATVAELIKESKIVPNSGEVQYSRRVFAANLMACIEHLSGGVVLAFSEAVNVSSHMLRSWLERGTRPSLEGFLRLTFGLGPAAHKILLSPGTSKIDIENMVSLTAARFHRQQERRSPDALTEALQNELKSEECRSLQSLAKSLGYNSTTSLYKADADLCRQVSDTHSRQFRASEDYIRPNKRKCGDAEIEAALNVALLEELPPRPKDIARQLGYSSDMAIRHRFRGLVEAVIKRRNECEESQRTIRREVLQAAIAEVPPPSIHVVSARHGRGFSTYLLKREADLVRELRNAIKLFEQRQKGEILRALEGALIEHPAPTLRIVEGRLECSITVMRKLCPAMVAQITARGRKYRSEEFRKKRRDLEQEVLAIVTELKKAEMPPRYDCVISMLDKTSLYKWDDMSKAIQKARQTLGLDPAKTGPVPKRAK